MSSKEKYLDSAVTASYDNRTRSVNTRYENPQARRNRYLYIIIGVVIAVVIDAAVAITVPLVDIKHKENESSEQKNECGPFSYPGVDISSLTPRIISDRKTCPLKGDCWTGKQCYQCFKLPRWKVGNINNIPVCCENCEISGLYLSNDECRCRHNGG